MTENQMRLRRAGSRSRFPIGLRKKLAASGYKIERRYVKLPTIAELWRAIERDEPVWVTECWLIVPNRAKRATKARVTAPSEKELPGLTTGT